MVYDVTDPEWPDFVQYINNRDFNFDPVSCETDATADACVNAGDLSAVDVLFIPRQESPDENPLLVVANDRSGTTTLFEIERDDDNGDDGDGDGSNGCED